MGCLAGDIAGRDENHNKRRNGNEHRRPANQTRTDNSYSAKSRHRHNKNICCTARPKPSGTVQAKTVLLHKFSDLVRRKRRSKIKPIIGTFGEIIAEYNGIVHDAERCLGDNLPIEMEDKEVVWYPNSGRIFWIEGTELIESGLWMEGEK